MMSAVRIAVEHGFGRTQKQWSHTSWSLANKEGLQPVAAYYFAGVLLTNCYTCLRGNQVADGFLIHPPSLDYYLQTAQRGQRDLDDIRSVEVEQEAEA